ncbi:MAG: O-antigen ligase family protein [Acidimicrobiia bacterium]
MSTLPATIAPTLRRRLLLALVALLPLHTVFVDAWVAWKPWLLLLIGLTAIQAWDGLRRRVWPWHRGLSIGVGLFLAGLAASGPTPHMTRFTGLWFAAAAGGALLLSLHLELTNRPGTTDAVLRIVFRSGAAMGATALIISLVAVGAFGSSAAAALDELPGVARVVQAAYLDNGFLALTNWHTDPGYAAAWMNLWAVLAVVAWTRRLGSGRMWVDATVVGSLAYGVLMTLSRTGLLGLGVGMLLATWFAVREGTATAQVVRFLSVAALASGVLLAVTLAVDRAGVAGDLGEAFSFRLGQGASFGPSEGEAYPGADHRSVVWPIYWRFFLDDPLRGAGLGTGWAAGVQEPHNLALQLLGETGVVGLAGFVALFRTVVRGGVGRLGVLALATTLSASITQTVLFEPTWWFAAALASAHRTLSPSRE